MTTVSRRNMYIGLLVCFTFIAFAGIAYTVNSKTEDNINALLQSVDDSINGIHIKAEMVSTYNKAFRNQHEKQKEKFINNRNRMRKRSGHEVDIVPYKAKVFESDPVDASLIEILLLNHKTRTAYDLPGESEDYIYFYEPEKFYHICNEGLDTERKMVMIESISSIDSFNSTTAHTFGRGLTFYIEHPKQLEKISDNNLKLTIFSPSGSKEKVAEFELDPAKNHCWTKGRLFSNDGDVCAEFQAKDFRETEKTIFPYSVEITAYHEGKYTYKQQLSIKEVSVLPEDQKELDVQDDIPEDSIFPRSL